MTKATWHEASIALKDDNSRNGTVSVFFDYDLGNWVFGWRLGRDPSWYDLVIEIGPFRLSFTYWRPTDTGSVT